MIARKLRKEETGFYKDVRDALKKHLDNKLDALWKEEIGGADFFIAAIGSSMEVFGKYNKIIDDEGMVIRADRFLEDIRKIVTDYAVRQVLHNGFAGEITAMTRFYVLWRWAYGEAKLEFDDADKLAKGVGINLPQEWNRGFIEKDKEFIGVLGPDNRSEEQLGNSKELIDVLHHVLQLWKKGRSEDILRVLKETGFGKSDLFYRVGQAISESLPNGSKEKKLLEGFLQGKQRISEGIRETSDQRKLFD
jgi:adenine-specific DNA methylase